MDFKTKEYLTNRNSLRYLITNPFLEPLLSTLLNHITTNKILVINKKETCTNFNTSLFLILKKDNKTVNVKINISKDHLISIRLQYGNTEESLKTRDISTVMQTVFKPFN